MNLPSVSVLIPTLNSAGTLEECLASICEQDYPEKLLEIIVADGGSFDQTTDVAKSYGATVVPNRLRTGEAGKATALRYATGDLVALIDSDNILPQCDWLRKMVAPFVEDGSVVGSEPWAFTRRKSDSALTRYCAMLGMNDPICHFIGNYDRMNMLTKTWTSLPVTASDAGDFVIIQLEAGLLPTIGANGTFWRRDALQAWKTRDYLFDVDVVSDLVEGGRRRFAKVKVGIVHLYANGLRQFASKQIRRVRDYLYFREFGQRSYPWDLRRRIGIFWFVIACVMVIPLIRHTWLGYRRSRDPAWLLHLPACWLTLLIYVWGLAIGKVRPLPQSRRRWNV